MAGQCSATEMPKTEKKIRKLVDEKKQFEIIPNGHASFLTKAARARVVDGQVGSMQRSTLEPLPEERAAKTSNQIRIPEPADEYGSGKQIVTLRLRALPGRSLPDLFEGDFISGTVPSSRGEKKRGRYESVKEFVERSGYREFRVLDIYWGTKSLANYLAGDRSSSRRSTSDTNAFVVCEAVI